MLINFPLLKQGYEIVGVIRAWLPQILMSGALARAQARQTPEAKRLQLYGNLKTAKRGVARRDKNHTYIQQRHQF